MSFKFQPHRLRLLIGGYLFTGGFVLICGGIQQQNKVGNKLKIFENNFPKNLCTEGVYKYSRNPIYIGGILSVSALPFFMPNKWLVLANGLIVWSFLTYLHFEGFPNEEKYLLKRFGNEYKQYCNNVGRWFGNYSQKT